MNDPAGARDWFPGLVPAIERDLPPACVVVVDAEEDFDWDNPVEGTDHSTHHMHNLGTLQSVLGAYGAVPAYLVTYPVLRDPEAVRALRREHERGRCTIGLQLHSWVTPPLLGRSDPRDSFAGGLPGDGEARKLETLVRAFRDALGFAPTTYRAGRYGIGPNTGRLLDALGITVDVSIAPRVDFSAQGGPDLRGYDYEPFWYGGSPVLSLPLGRSVVGLAARLGASLLSGAERMPGGEILVSLLSRLRLAERVTLSPEGNDPAAMRRLVRGLRERGRRVFPLSFHSSSIAIGRSPYVRDKAELHAFFDRLSAALSFLADDVGCDFIPLDAAPGRFLPPGAAR